MAGLGAKDILRNVTALEQLIEEINFQRAKEMRQCLMSKDSGRGRADTGFVMVQGTTYWTDLFVRHFLFQTDRSTDADDLLFFIRKKQLKGSRYIPKYQTEVEVYRRDSRKLPIGDPDIDWEETVYLNLIIHQFDYTLTLAVCTRTSPKDLQVLRRHSQKVYASPSRRRMDTKGEVEEITYPSVCFHVDNFDEVFADMLVRDGEMVCVELVAADHAGTRQAVIFLGSIRYDALKRVYDARASLSSKVAQRMMMGLFAGNSNQRIEFVRMKGPQGKGHAEMAVTKPKGSGVETPTSEPGVSLTDMWDCDWEDEPEDRFIYRHQRRLSDPSANFNTFINSGWKSRPEGARSRSENEGLDYFADGLYEIESGDVRDAVCSGRCCSVVACNTIREEEETPQAVRCAKCLHFHGDQTVSSNPNPPSLRVLAARQIPPSALQSQDAAGINLNLSVPNSPSSNLPGQTLDLSSSRPQSPQEDSPLLPSCPESPLIPQAVIHVQSAINSEPRLSGISVPNPNVMETKGDLTDSSVVPDKSTELGAIALKKENTFVMIKDTMKTRGSSGDVTETSFICKDIQEQIVKANKSSLSLDSLSLRQIHTQPIKKSHSPSHSPPKGARNRESPVSPTKSRNKKPGSAQRVHSPPESQSISLSSDKYPNTPVKESASHNNLLGSFEDLSHDRHSESTPSTSRLGAGSPLSDDEDPENINESSKLLGSPIPSTSKVQCDPLGAVGDMEGFVERPQFQKSLSIDSAQTKAQQMSDSEGVEVASESLTALNLSPVKKKRKVTVPYRMTPDGTRVNFLCDVQLDDGAYNPLWTTKGFTQTFHFWKESRRAQSVPLNAYLTYVTLPWFTIITDILDHRTGPILTF